MLLTASVLLFVQGVVSAVSNTSNSSLISFVTLGDWGGAGIEAVHKTAELSVAHQLSTSAAALSAQFLINVGDNFYHYGVKSKNDTQWQSTFENVYKEESMMIPWYSVLGNTTTDTIQKHSCTTSLLTQTDGSCQHVTGPDVSKLVKLHNGFHLSF